MDKNMALIGRRVKFLRMERNIQQTKLAEMIGVSQTHLSNVEGGKAGLTIPNLIKIRHVLDCPISEFFVDIEDGAPVKVANPVEEISVEDIIKIAKVIKGLK